MARTATVIAFVLIGLGWIAVPALAAERDRMQDPFEISADRITFDQARDLYIAEGRVVVDHADRRMKARWMTFSKATRIGVAEGDVQLDDGEDHLTADFMVFDVDSLRGLLYQGSLDAGSAGFLVRARELVRTGDNTFTVRDAAFSTCRCEPGEKLPWEIKAAKGDVEMGGYGTVTNSTFNVLGVPVLWVPWTFFPVKSERETGFLLPDFAFGGRGGANFGLPFFWAALPQLNVTLTPRYFAEKGYKQDVELEYVFGERSGGRLFVAGLRDQDHESTSEFRNDRWAVIWDHDQELPADWRWQTDFKLASDNLYSDDFIELRPYRTFRFMESTTNVARDFGESGGVGSMAAIRFADDIQSSTFDDRDEYILQRWAEVRGDVQPGTLEGPFGIEARVDSEVIYFSGFRSVESELSGLAPTAGSPLQTDGRFFDIGVNGRVDGPADSTEANGIFEPGEPIADRGTRVVIHPRVARSFQIGRFAEFTPEVGWQQSLYEANSKKFAQRGLATVRTDLRGRLARDYHSDGGRAVRHIVEPRLEWAYVSQQRQTKNPLFIPRGSVGQDRLRTLSLENVTRDPSDRIASANQLVLSVGQRFFSRDRKGQGARLRGDLVTALDWDFTNHGGLGNFYAEGRLFPIGPLSARVRGAINPKSGSIHEGEVGFTLRLPVPGILLRAVSIAPDYRYRRRVPLFAESYRGESGSQEAGDDKLNQLSWTSRVELTERVRLSYRGVYTFVQDGGFLQNRGTVEYVSKCRCWGVGVSLYHEKEQGFAGGLQIRFLGLGDRSGGSLFDGGLGAGMNL